MATPSDTDRRKARDQLLRQQDDAIAEHLAQALRSGELRRAPSFGKPMPPAEGWHETPVEFRLPFKILKDAGIPPPELALFHERAALREALQACGDGAARQAIQQRLGEVEQVLALRLEGMRASGRL